jgi:hypothetical protein
MGASSVFAKDYVIRVAEISDDYGAPAFGEDSPLAKHQSS